jgi:hypothetical protein
MRLPIPLSLGFFGSFYQRAHRDTERRRGLGDGVAGWLSSPRSICGSVAMVAGHAHNRPEARPPAHPVKMVSLRLSAPGAPWVPRASRSCKATIHRLGGHSS